MVYENGTEFTWFYADVLVKRYAHSYCKPITHLKCSDFVVNLAVR